MLRNYIDPGALTPNCMLCGMRLGLRRGARWRGFSLVELLAVIVIVSLLMAAASGLLGSAGSRSMEPAARIAHGIEYARAQAVAKNRDVAIRFDWIDNRELAMRFLWTRPGQAATEVAELRRSERLMNIVISPALAPRNPVPDGLPAHHLAADESLVVSPDGQVFVGTGSRGFPVADDELLPVIYVGVQPTRDGKVIPSEKRDVAIVQVQCATGTARVMQP